MPDLKVLTSSGGAFFKQCAISNLAARPLCPLPGIHAEILYAILTTLGLPYKLIPEKRKVKVETTEDHWWLKGPYGELYKGTVDLPGIASVSTVLKRQYFSYSYAIDDLEVVFMTAGPDENLMANTGLLFQVFGVYVWLALILCFVLYFVVRISMKLIRKYVHSFKTHWLNLASTVLGFGIVVFVNLYAGVMLTELLHPEVSHSIRDAFHMVELIKRGHIHLITRHQGYIVDESIRQSDHSFFIQLREALKDNPLKYVRSYQQQVELIKTGKYVAATTDFSTQSYKRYNCNIRVIGDEALLPRNKVAFMFRKNFTLLPKFNMALLSLQEHTARVYAKYRRLYEIHVQCEEKHHTDVVMPLGVMSLFGAFLVLVAAATICTIVFAVEYIHGRPTIQSILGRHESYGMMPKFSKHE